jgi:hypothetical protein
MPKPPPKKALHLSVVTRGRSASRPQVITPEALTEVQAARAQSYILASGASGVFVGALVGEAAWDIKPLLLEHGVLSVLRFSDPAMVLHQAQYSFYNRLSRSLPGAALLRGAYSGGKADAQFWQRRLFYQRALSELEEIGEESLGVHPVTLAQKLVDVVKAWRRDNIIHGHLCPANVAVEEQSPVVMDYGLCALSSDLSQNAKDLAPEIGPGSLPTYASDIYGLGLVLGVLLEDFVSEEQDKVIGAMLSAAPAARPAIDQVIAGLFPGAAGASRAGVVRSLPERDGLKLGKVLGKHLQVEQGEGAAMEEPQPASIPARGDLPQAADHRGRASKRAPADTLQWLKGTVVLGEDIVQKIKDSLAEPGSDGESAHEEQPPLAGGAEVEANKASDIRGRINTVENVKSFIEKNEKREPPEKISWWFWVMLIVPLILVILHKQGVFSGRVDEEEDVRTIPYADYWQSNLTSKMKEVAAAAVSGKSEAAEMLIVKEALGGQNRPRVRSAFLRIAFNPQWEGELSPLDRQLALKLGLYELLGGQSGELPPLASAHPGVLFAIIGSLKMEDGERSLAGIPLHSLTALPAPYGPGFAELERLGIKDLGGRPVRAWLKFCWATPLPKSLRLFFATMMTPLWRAPN